MCFHALFILPQASQYTIVSFGMVQFSVIIKSLPGVPAVDSESILFLDDGSGFGQVRITLNMQVSLFKRL